MNQIFSDVSESPKRSSTAPRGWNSPSEEWHWVAETPDGRGWEEKWPKETGSSYLSSKWRMVEKVESTSNPNWVTRCQLDIGWKHREARHWPWDAAFHQSSPGKWMHSLAAKARVLHDLGRWRNMALREHELEEGEQVLSAAEEVKAYKQRI